MSPGLGGAAALLLASSLAPSDPVLASDVQVGLPAEDHEDEPRFVLASEAGLNHGLASPFVKFSIAWRGLAGLPACYSRIVWQSTCYG